MVIGHSDGLSNICMAALSKAPDEIGFGRDRAEQSRLDPLKSVKTQEAQHKLSFAILGHIDESLLEGLHLKPG